MTRNLKPEVRRELAERRWATGVIRSQMVKRGISYAQLTERLKLMGVEENERNLRNKVARGTFSAAFMGECLAALGVRHLEIDVIDALTGIREAIAFDRTIDRLNAGIPIEQAKVELDEIDDPYSEEVMARKAKKFGSLK
ncbi:DUF6471 domain-containing protein [Oceanicaulis alexandrii]|uniref:DUF6471 domain-containing protein n=1 Tax=Oceanicaulis alexandrii TaxID=153233 RepID=UPI0003B77916|nr:DUF6471 domain-containing protein [Oceanicaulis alexandrii]